MRKRGQVTVFIILGIVVLAVFSLIFFFRGEITKTDFQTELSSVKVTEQLKPAKFYIDDCAEDTVLRGARILGSSGGYMGLPDDTLPRSIVNPFSNSLQLGSSEVAYWYYKSANNLDKEQIPTIESMEEDLENYLNKEFHLCLRGLDDFLDEGFEIEQSQNIISAVNIEDTHIEVIIFSPTDISLGDVGQYFDKHLIDVEVNLGKLYKQALEVYEKEKEDKFLEEKTIDMMVVYDDIPFSDTEFECRRLSWQKSEVEKDFRLIVERNLGALRLDNSKYVKTNEDNDYFKIDLRGDEEVTTTFEYLRSWPFTIDVTPSSGDTLVGDSITQGNPDVSKYLNLFFCLNNYHFVYDVKYPTLISFNDDVGFTFQFANMVVIEKNTPRNFEGEILSFDDPGILGEEFCGNRFNELDVLALDSSNLAGVDGVDISYSCFSTNCYIGKTNDFGELIDKFPICVNGEIHANKEGYFSNSEIVSTDVDSKFNVFLEPVYELNVKTKVVELSTGKVRDIQNGEDAVFQLENLDNGYVTTIVTDSGEVNLVAGTYIVTTYLMKEADTPLKIEGQTYVECIDTPRSGVFGFLGFSKEECFETKVDDSEIESFIAGGAKFQFTLTHNDLLNNDIIFYAPYEKEPRTTQDMLDIIGNIEVNGNNRNFVFPKVE